MKGDRRSVRRGTSIEFADYRDYTRGDDLRRLDWNIYARLQRPYIKLLEDEEDLAVHILLDASASMDWPTEETGASQHHKFTFAKRLTAGLAYAALTANDRLMVTACGEQAAPVFGPARGRGRALALLHFLGALPAGGTADLNQQMQAYTLRVAQPGLLFVISDLLMPQGLLDGLNALLGKGHEVVVLHVLSPEEVEPPLTGDLRLVDMETGAGQEISLDGGLLALYRQRFDAWREDIRREVLRRGGHYLFVETSQPWERVILQDMRRLGLLR